MIMRLPSFSDIIRSHKLPGKIKEIYGIIQMIAIFQLVIWKVDIDVICWSSSYHILILNALQIIANRQSRTPQSIVRLVLTPALLGCQLASKVPN